jgi:hypothetical protein
MSGMLPSSVSYFMSRLQGVSTSHFKITPQTAGDATPSKIIRFELPSNSLVNLASLRMLFNVATSGGTAASLPNGTHSLIERIAVYAGGYLVGNGYQGYNVLCQAKKAICGDMTNPALEHSEMVRAISYHAPDGTFPNLTPIGESSAESYTDVDDALAILKFEGFLGTLKPEIIDTGLLPQLTVEITLAEASVVSNSAGRKLQGHGSTDFTDDGSSSTSYTLSNISMEVEVLGMASAVLDQLVEQRISAVGFLSCPFKNYFTSISTHATTSRFNVSSASWDRLWLAYRDTGFATQSAPSLARGYKRGGAEVLRASALVDGAVSSSATLVIDNLNGIAPKVGDRVRVAGVTAEVTITAVNSATNYTMSSAQSISDNAVIEFYYDVGAPTYDLGGSLDTNKEKYIPAYFKFEQVLTSSSSPAFVQLQVNNASIPAYRLNTPEALAMTLNSVEFVEKDYKLTLDQYKNDKYVQCFRFCLPDEYGNRLASGLDTRSVSAMCSVITDNIASCSLYMFAECTSELRIGAGRSIEVIV